jgi:hypothetical protein
MRVEATSNFTNMAVRQYGSQRRTPGWLGLHRLQTGSYTICEAPLSTSTDTYTASPRQHAVYIDNDLHCIELN